MRTNTSVKSKTVKPNHLTAIKDLSLKVRSPDGSNLNSARQHQKTNENENRMFQFSRCELDNKLREFSQAIFKNKSFQKSTPTSCLNDLKKSFFEILKGGDKELSMKNKRNSENINQEFSFLLREAELQRRINELEEDKITYEEKIENHTSYIADLESKVDRLIDEYENTLKVNQTLMSEIQSSKNETTVWSGSDPKDRSNSETVAEVESLRLLNSQLQNQMSYAHENICKLEDMLRQACLQDARNLKYYEEIQKVQSQLTDRSTRSHNSDLLENLAQSVQQEQRTEILTESREAELQREIADYQSQIENLTALMKKTNEELKSTKVKCSELEDEVLSFNNFDNALQEKIKLLEEQVKNLSEENVALQAIKEENSATISTLKDQIKEKIQPGSYVEDPKDQSMDSLIDLGFLCPKGYVPSLNNFVKESDNTLEKSLKAKEKELEDEKMNHKLQIEKYTMSLTTLSGKVQILVSINENLTRDMEYMKQESNNYRTIIWSIYQQIKKHLDVYKVKDDELQHHFKAPAKNDSDKLDFIVYFYQQLRKEVGLIDCLLEERRNYI